ncbi:hypothetical protein DRJ04_03085 [Candidatus Aerophobetes bacterium]|mgnify:CR=1 FL=1|uniref:Type II secretion system protein n=1 Tax=Aerophobetes bacterium TaxID=2030807 RepID=A0A662DIS9_UNCAE|nr:MAG: hypothetical protein DRJ04_03085 [Candidatus Aerophobetes bacterium]
MRKNIKKGGFTLVEIIIIIGILSFGLLTFAKVFPYGFEAKRRAENYSRIGILAQSLVEDIIKDGYRRLTEKYPQIWPGYGKGSGKFEKHPQISWQVEWWQAEIPNLRKIKVKVYADVEKEDSPCELEIVTYLARRE